ncbi:MAG: hypothetical protein ACT4PU_08140 [Planctomycetota bacterium]
MRPQAVLLLFVGLGLVLLAGAFGDWERIGAKDWNHFLGQTQAEVSSLSEHGQFPLWSPWRRGGQVSFAQPESMFLSPVLPLALAVGTLAAFKLLLLPIFVFGCWGMWLLAGQIGLTGRARLVPALVFFGCSIYPLFVVAGLPNWLCSMAILPWLLYCWRRAQSDLRFVVAAALCWAAALACGSIYQFVFFPVLLGLDALLLALAQRSLRPLLTLAVLGLLGVALLAVRLLPLAEVYAQYPRHVSAAEDQLLVSLLPDLWLSQELPDLTTPKGPMIVTAEGATYWLYTGAYMGPAVLLLALLALARPRRAWPWLLLGGAFLWLALGSDARLSAWSALHALPVYSSMHSPQRLIFFTSFCLALLAGLGFSAVEDGLARPSRLSPQWQQRLVRWGPWLLLVALLLPMLMVNAPLTRHAFVLEPLPDLAADPEGEFRQRLIERRPEQWGGELYQSTLANLGNVDGFSDVPSPPAARHEQAPDYRGEVYLLSGAEGLRSFTLTPNEIRVQLALTAPDTLVVNQNWFPGWVAHSASGDEAGDAGEQPLVAHENLLSLPLPAGEHELVLHYAPASVGRGAVLSLAALGVGALYLLARRRQPVLRPGRPEAVASAATLALVLAFGACLPSLPEAPPEPSVVLPTALLEARRVEPGQSLQQALDSTPPGGVLWLEPGRHEGATIRRGLHLAALSGGAVEIAGSLVIEALPAGERCSVLGLADEPLLVRDAIRVRSGAGTVALQALQADVLEVEGDGALYLFECTLGQVRLSPAATGAAPQLVAVRSPGVASTVGPTRAAELALSGAPSAAQAARVRVTHSRFMGRSLILELEGPPGARGLLLIGMDLAAASETLQTLGLALDVSRPHASFPVVLDGNGRLTLRTRVPAPFVLPGRGGFAQLVLESAPGSGLPVLTPLDGRLLDLPQP